MRPMLGGRGTTSSGSGNTPKDADRAPSYRVPGASVAARAGTATACGMVHGGFNGDARGGNAGGMAAPPVANDNSEGTATRSNVRGCTIDAEGFQRVERRSGRRGGTSSATGEDGADGDDQAQGDADQQGDDGGATAGGREDGDGGDEEAPTPAMLQQLWLNEVALVRKLRSQGVQGGHPAMRAACEARDAAERAWRGSKEPAPASVRLGRAQAKLDRAVALQADARQAMLEAEKAHREKMAALQSAMGECTERVRLRRRQLREVQMEVGAGGARAGEGRHAKAQQDAIRLVHQTICAEVGPAIAALAEQVDTGAPAWTTLNGLLGKLSASKSALEGAVGPRHADHFDIGGGRHDDWDGYSEWSESHDVGGQTWGAEHGDQHDADDADGGCWEQQRGQRSWEVDADGDDGERDQPMGTGDWWDAPARRWGEGARWQPSGHGKWQRASWAEQTEEEMYRPEEDDGPPAAARRRLGAAPAELRGGAAQSMVPAEGAAAPKDDPEASKRKHAERLDQIISMAVDAGVTPLSQSGEDLQLLDPHQLDAWVAENLPSALLC